MNIEYRLTIDTSPAKAAMEEMKKAADELTAALEQANRAFEKLAHANHEQLRDIVREELKRNEQNFMERLGNQLTVRPFARGMS